MISVIVPVYNKVEELGQTIEALEKTLGEHGLEYEVVIVNDGSNDGTYKEASAIAQRSRSIVVVGYEQNKGKGYALKYGFKFTHGELVLFQDADSDLPPSQIPQFLEYMDGYNTDVVVGSKWHPLSQVDFPRSRKFLSKGYSLMVRLLFNLDIRETQVGLKLFKREVLERVMPKMIVKRFSFDVELLAITQSLGYSIIEAPVKLNYNSDSRLTLRDIWNIFIDTLAVFYRINISHIYDKERK